MFWGKLRNSTREYGKYFQWAPVIIKIQRQIYFYGFVPIVALAPLPWANIILCIVGFANYFTLNKENSFKPSWFRLEGSIGKWLTVRTSLRFWFCYNQMRYLNFFPLIETPSTAEWVERHVSMSVDRVMPVSIADSLKVFKIGIHLLCVQNI